MYVVLFFEAHILAHVFWFYFCAISLYVVLFFEEQVLAHYIGLFVCDQDVSVSFCCVAAA
jgi:hypothetical protein